MILTPKKAQSHIHEGCIEGLREKFLSSHVTCVREVKGSLALYNLVPRLALDQTKTPGKSACVMKSFLYLGPFWWQGQFKICFSSLKSSNGLSFIALVSPDFPLARGVWIVIYRSLKNFKGSSTHQKPACNADIIMLKMHESDHVCGLNKVNYQIVCHLYYSILINGTQFDVMSWCELGHLLCQPVLLFQNNYVFVIFGG